MSRILIRAKASPFEYHDVQTTLTKSLLGDNSGNLLFAYSAARLLDNGENELDFIADYKTRKTRSAAKWINESFDHLVLPMANSFRASYLEHLVSWTKLIRMLTIPCTVLGVGIQMKSGETYSEPHPYDEAVRDFVSAVLEHSAKVAVRGDVTAAYLEHLGFKDIEVTGCPSFALAGREFPISKPPSINRNASGTATGSIKSPPEFQRFMRTTLAKLPNCYYVPQRNDDLRLMYYGTPITRKRRKKSKLSKLPIARTLAAKSEYPRTLDDPIFAEDRARFFIDVKSMLDFNRTMDFNFGSRIHGCISNIVCGVPSILFSQDQRVGELASYHHLPLFSFDNIKRTSTLEDYFEKLDLAYMRQGHEERFDRLIGFLDDNALPHVWQNGKPDVFPADEKLERGGFQGPIRAACAELSGAALEQRLENGRNLML